VSGELADLHGVADPAMDVRVGVASGVDTIGSPIRPRSGSGFERARAIRA
jgi:hypothetical protein